MIAWRCPDHLLPLHTLLQGGSFVNEYGNVRGEIAAAEVRGNSLPRVRERGPVVVHVC